VPIDTDSIESEKEIKNFLRGHLPGYMVPDYYMMLEKLPLTANGKVDRKALPVPDIRRTAEQREAPVGEIEQLLTEIVSSILRKETIGVTDNFFGLGGNSLDIISIYNAIEEKWGFAINMTDLFRLADVRQISKLITAWLETEENFEEIDL
jgi:acyl carrier protein